MRTTVFETASVLADLGWDELLQNGEYYSSVQWLEYLRELHSGYYHAYGATLIDGRIQAGVSLHEVDVDSHPLIRPDACLAAWLASERSEHGSKSILPEATARLMPTLSLGGRTPGMTTFLHRPSLKDQEYCDLLESHLDQAERIASDRGMRSVTLPYVDHPLMQSVLIRRGYIRYSTETNSAISLVGKSSFDDYIDHLPGHETRKRIRRDRRKVSAAGWTFQVVRLEDSPLEEICRLQAIGADQHGVPGGFEEALRKQKLSMRMLPGQSWVAIGRDVHGQMGSCSIFIRWRDELYSRQGGEDPDLTRGYPVFFETCFYQTIEHGVATGATSIQYSVTAADSKRRRGCLQRTQDGYIKCLDADDQKWLEMATEKISPDNSS
ncbi:peptidogalycan biosysnthesis protein [Streptomyces sp. NPDC058751]|uniref:peptidogalycan biosysnthesis protein n=1 Tax=Streptomyces sp. NPDC058751 TaxID=3346623 RepID=UPI003693B7DE